MQHSIARLTAKSLLLLLCVIAVTAQTQNTEPTKDGDKPSAVWDKEPDQFKGVAWNATLEEAKRAVNFQFCTGDPKQDTTCILRVDITQHYSLVCYFNFHQGRFADVSGSFPSEHYQELRDLFVDKYGQPTTSGQEPVRDGNGTEYTQETVVWQGKVIELAVSRFADTVEHGSVLFIPVATLEEKRKRDEEQKKKALQ